MLGSARKKRGTAAGIAAMLLATVAACGGGSETESSSASGAGEGESSGQSYSWQYANYLPPNSSLSTAIADYFTALEDEGNFEVEEFYQESLLAATDMMPGVSQGRADLGFMIALYFPGELPLSQIVGVPFETDDAEAQVKAFNELYESNEAFRAEYDEQGIHVISFSPVAPTMVATKEPLPNFEALKGKKIRAVGLLSQAMQIAGVNPVALPAPEIYESVERGVIEGFTSYPFDVAVANSLHEVAPHMTDVGTGLYNLGALIMTKSTWDGLDEDAKQTMTGQVDAYVANAIRLLAEEEEDQCTAFLEAGGTPAVFSDEDVAKFKSAVGDSVLNAWREQVTKAGVNEADADGFFEEYKATLSEQAENTDYVPGLVGCAERAGS